MINFILEVTGIQRLYERWVVAQARKRAEAEERLFQQNLKNLWNHPADYDGETWEDDNES